VFARLEKESVERIHGLAAHGTTIVLVDAHDHFPWQSSQPEQLNEPTTSYSVGTGRVLELSEAVTEPETFAQDIRRLLGKRNALATLCNGLATIAVPYKGRDGTQRVIEFVNYAGDLVRVQVQVKGAFTSLHYESPEHGCCESLAPVSMTDSANSRSRNCALPDAYICSRNQRMLLANPRKTALSGICE
jgi:hypothetical protein